MCLFVSLWECEANVESWNWPSQPLESNQFFSLVSLCAEGDGNLMNDWALEEEDGTNPVL